MKALELKVPPLLLMVAVAGLMALLAPVTPTLPLEPALRLIGTTLATALGVTILVAGALAFRRADTTVNPTTPEASRQLVVQGIYRRSRNPMYLGMLALLLGWGLFLASPAALALLPAFVLYLNRFQIQPEERALRARFGADFDRYCQQVGRWF
ncbi:methyltransferase family protein [Ferrimonas balearica]|uniref:methyltransferase family protein n=1 Tax=Ferrimonas balearica TaxID=44012 RepID=UPI001C9A204D|nr:isoprenylcysteine carboxylmethyltransferase family protein [Ferrimonas balearica]MBY5993193.1 isoprenylcysteine carboxylmethyltransferase family protein [Ferrimonas balearica]